MKTRTNKASIAANRDNARKLEAQARALRSQARQMQEAIKDEEEAILKNMVETLMDSGCSMTARQISAAIGESMSVHEVAGQLSFAYTSRDAGTGYRHGRHHMAHEVMAEIAPAVEVEEQVITHVFAEVSEDGRIIPGGRTFKQAEKRNIYAINRR